jgi:type I restriction enzyme M protein
VKFLRDRRGEVLFIDARKMGVMTDRTHRDLTDDEIARIASTYHAWRGELDAGDYEDVPGFCKRATLDEIRDNDHILTPGRYVGTEAEEGDAESIDVRLRRLSDQLETQFDEALYLQSAIRQRLARLELSD